VINKDSMIFAVFGILIGFISGYLMHEVVAARQPPRLTPELRAMIGTSADPTAAPAPAPGPANAGMPQGAAPAGPSMEEVQQLRAYVEKNPNDADAVLKLANLNFDIAQYQRAQDLYTQYLKLRPSDADVLTDLGISYRKTKNYDQALEQFQKARKLAPDHWQSYYNEVVVLAFDLKRHDEAGQLLQELQRMQPSNPDVAKLAEAVTRQRNAA
jgi:cytochrome c-type biogenesis protein CcmH/NrfG